MNRIIFSDVDGTLLTSEHRISEQTREAIISLKNDGVPLVIVSARSPSGIATIVNEVGIPGGFGPITAYSGGLIMADDRVLFSRGMEKGLAGEILRVITENGFKAAWCLYSFDQWLVRDRTDPRIIREEEIVQVQAEEGTMDSVVGDVVHKIMCISSDSAETDLLESCLKERFPQCAVVKSCATQLEIMRRGVNKGLAVLELCNLLGVPVENSVAFGDNYNDVEMLEAAGRAYIMANAPEDLKKRGFSAARTNDDDGVFYALKELNFV